jgi:RNA polymerase sigma factor (sigma-70 family)
MHLIDQELLSQLLDEHSAALVLYAQQWCAQPEDVVQEAFIRLIRERPAPENIVGWLYRVVRNEAISASRAAGRRARYESAVGSQREAWFTSMGEDALDARAAVAALEALLPEEREVIVLRIWGGRSFEQIAELIGKSTSTAHRRYEMGLRSLREKWSISCLDQTITK